MGNPYHIGSTIRLRGILKDFDGSSLVPDTKEIKIYDGEGTLVNTIEDGDILAEEDGIYYYDYVIPSKTPGKWKQRWDVSKNDKPDVKIMEFEVIV